jgi:5-oxoprolinase (ATP-hydrolysing)
MLGKVATGLSKRVSEVKVRFNIDRGGTFTDVYAEVCNFLSQIDSKVLFPTGQVDYRVLKLLSEDPSNYENAPREAIRRILNDVYSVDFVSLNSSQVAQTQLSPQDKIPTNNIEWIRMGTTVATNALLERNAAETNKKYKGNLPPPRRVALVSLNTPILVF